MNLTNCHQLNRVLGKQLQKPCHGVHGARTWNYSELKNY